MRLEATVMRIRRAALPVSHQGCGGGARLTVERILRHTPGVQTAYVNPATEMAYLEYDPAFTSPEQLGAVLQRSGFGPTDREAVLESRPPGPGSPGPTEGGGP